MQRRVFDQIATGIGAVIVVVLLVAGGLMTWGYTFAHSNVHDQLAQQQIYFPPKSAFDHPKAGTEITYGGIYSKVSAAKLAAKPGSPQATQLGELQTTVFQGTTLRGLLLQAY